MRSKTAAFGTGRIVTGRPFHEFPALDFHIAARPDPFSVSGDLARTDPRHSKLRLDPEKHDQIIERLDRPPPFQRRAGKDPAVMARRLVEQQPDALVGIPRPRERRIGRQPEKVVGVEMGDIELFGERTAERCRAGTGRAHDMDMHHDFPPNVAS